MTFTHNGQTFSIMLEGRRLTIAGGDRVLHAEYSAGHITYYASLADDFADLGEEFLEALEAKLRAIRRYRFCMNTAHIRGERRHAQTAIRAVAPDARDFQPVPIADCWLFTAEQIKNPPAWIIDVGAAP